MNFRIPPRLRPAWRLLRLPILVLAYLVLRPILVALSATHGFGSPAGMSLPYLAIAALEVVLRVALLTVIPAVLVYRVITCLLLGEKPSGAVSSREIVRTDSPSSAP
ncbi:hypothetical protein ACFVUS_39205 [Nocardia sp. NPDC058058]|uniref:hypothetical protein n=1 Tax=Nocardia sp. NPDC058058 TaxID=3346317 RepID=UPI0036DF8FB7